MNRFSRDSVPGGRSGAVGSASLLLQQRRPRAAVGRDGGDEGLDLFSRTRRSLPVVPALAEEECDRKNGPPKLGSISMVPAKAAKSGIDDLLSGADIGKHDYDWLLTPPGTPISSSLDREHQLPSVAPKTNSSARPVATAKASRFSVSQTENNHSTRPARSSSLTRPSISSTYSGHFSNNSNRTTALNTSTASITSYRPSTPTKRPTTACSTTRQTTVPSSRPTSSRPSTPIKSRPNPSSSADKAPCSNGDKTRPLHGTRPSTPTSRPQISTGLNSSSSSVANRTSSRPSTPSRSSTPSRRAPAPSPAPVSSRPSTPTHRTTPAPATRSPSVGKVPTANSRNSGPSSRPSSPSPRIRPSAQPVVLPGFPHEAPPNLRTKLPERPASAGRTRPGASLTARANLNSEAPAPANSTRRPSPIATRGRLPESSPKTQLRSNGHETTPPEVHKSLVPNGVVKKPVKPATTTESTGFGRTISKKSLDMALRHMDIRQGVGGIRGASLFPQSIRSAASKGRPARVSDPVAPISRNGIDAEGSECGISISGSYNGAISENGDSITMLSPDRDSAMKRATAPDVYESTRYDAILLKEDSKNMSWLHSIEDRSDQSPVFDHRFEPLPEPFALP